MARVARHPRVARKQAAVVRAVVDRAQPERTWVDTLDTVLSAISLVLTGVSLGLLLAKIAIEADEE